MATLTRDAKLDAQLTDAEYIGKYHSDKIIQEARFDTTGKCTHLETDDATLLADMATRGMKQ